MPADSPFAPLHSHQSFLETLGGGEALRRLNNGLGSREPFLIVTGDPGTGKTALAVEAIKRWGSRVAAAFLAYPVLTGAELVEEIIRRFGAEPPDGASRPKLVACLERALAGHTDRGQVAIIVVDDAHSLSAELLEELRLLVNAAQQLHRPIEVLLIGLPALTTRLDQPALAALRQRVSVRAKLEPLSAVETRSFLHHRVTAAGGDGASTFPSKTCREIAALTSGVPRQINVLAAEALSLARAAGHASVAPEHVRSAAAALWDVVQTGGVEDSADAGADASPAPVAAAHAPAKAAPPVAEPAHAATSPVAVPTRPATPPEAASARPAPPAVVAPVAEGAIPAHTEEVATPVHATPASHDPREWVARFVGDKGPLQLSSRAVTESTRAPESLEPAAGEAPSPAETPRARRNPSGGAQPHSRSERKGDLRLVTTVSLAAIVIIAAVALVIRTGGLSRSRAGQAEGVATTADSQQDAGKASSSRALKTGASSARAASATRSAERASIGSTARSKRPYTLDVGGYDDLESALDARVRMQDLTGFEGWVVTANEGGVETYRIVLGVYRSHARATAATRMLLDTRTLREVTVVPLPPQSSRQ